MTLVGLTLGCGGKRLVSSIKRGEKLDLRSADWCGRPSWHVSGTGRMPGVGGVVGLAGWGGGLFLWQHYLEPGVRSSEAGR